MKKPKPCPFCGAQLSYEETVCRALPGDPVMRYFKHPKNGCFCDAFEISPDDIPAWNERM